jgi:hypothetical protein
MAGTGGRSAGRLVIWNLAHCMHVVRCPLNPIALYNKTAITYQLRYSTRLVYNFEEEQRNASYTNLMHLAVPYGGRQDARLEPKYKQLKTEQPRATSQIKE